MPQFSKTLARELNEIKSNPMTPDKSTMSKTELQFAEEIKKHSDLYKANEIAKVLYQLHRKEAIRFALWIGEYGCEQTGESTWYNYVNDEYLTIEKLFERFTSSNEGNNEKE